MAPDDPAAPFEHVWQLLSRPRLPGEDGYFEHVRTELLDLLAAPPRRFVEIGCGTGLTGAEVKRRYPAATVDGFEYNPAAAAAAAERLDNVHAGDAERMDIGALYAPGSIDALLLADVLEHLYDPWSFLERMRPCLAREAQVIASIPNVRNLKLLGELAAGTFAYEAAGLLDVTHIRFFTRSEILKLFDQTGYDVLWIGNVRDQRIPDLAPAAFPCKLETASIDIHVPNAEALTDLMTVQFYVRAQPRS
jgi:SAM-dependent methyltransferase